MKKTTCGVVGCGLISQLAHIPNLLGLEECELVALCDVRREVAEKVQRKYGIPKVYGSIDELLGDKEIQSVVITIPQYLHAQNLLKAVSSGKYVFTEKPLAVSSEEGRKIVDAVKKNNTKLMVGFMKRYDAGVRKAKSLIDYYNTTGEIGEISYAKVHNFTGDWLPGIPIEKEVIDLTRENVAKKSEPNVGEFLKGESRVHYGNFIYVYLHDVNLMRYLLGEPKKILYGRKQKMRGTQPGTEGGLPRINWLIDFGGFDAIFEIGCLHAHYFDEEVKVYFDSGWIEILVPAPLKINSPAKVTVYTQNKGFEKPLLEWKWSFREELRVFFNWISGKGKCDSTAEDSLNDLIVAENLWRLFVE